MVEASLVNLAELGVLVVGVVIALRQLNDIKKTRETELETRQLQLYSQNVQITRTSEWIQALIKLLIVQNWEDFDDFMRKYGPETNLQEYAYFFTVLEVYQTMGVLLEQEAIDIEMMYRHNGEIIIRVWEKVESFVKEFRQRRNSPLMYRSFENLYNDIKNYREQHPELAP